MQEDVAWSEMAKRAGGSVRWRTVGWSGVRVRDRESQTSELSGGGHSILGNIGGHSILGNIGGQSILGIYLSVGQR